MIEFNLDASGLGLASVPADAHDNFEHIVRGCSFLTWVFEEDQIFDYRHKERFLAALSILARANDRETLHLMFEKTKHGYSAPILDELIDEALQLSGPRTCDSINRIRGNTDCLKCPYFAECKIASPINIKALSYIKTESTGFWEVKYNKANEAIPVRPHFIDLAKAFQRENEFISVADSGNIFVQSENHWVIQENSYIKAFAQEKLEPKPKEYQRNEFLNLLKVTNIRKPDWFNTSTESLINLQNGAFCVQSGELKAHSPDYGFRYILPYAYNPDARCPLFIKFLSEVTKDRQDLADVIIEFMGYSLANGPCFAEKAVILYGEGENGKSTLMETWQELAGKDNYSGLALTALNDPAKRYMVDGKLFNMGEETNVKALADSEVFKTMVTGGEIDVKKLYSQPYSIKNRCKLIMACNTLPKSNDRTHGLYRRMILIPFDAVFSDAKGNKDPLMKLKLKAELPGIFNLALEGYRRLAANNYKFTKSETIAQAVEDYKLENDNILMWMKERLQYTGDQRDWSYKDQVYDDYKKFVEDSGGYKVNKVWFFRTIKNRLPDIRESKRVGMNGQMRVLLGVKVGDFFSED